MDQRKHSATRPRWLATVPSHVDVYEVGPRDGLQNESLGLSTDEKIALIEALIEAGLRRIEVTSFVSPKWIPQLADADELLKRLGSREGCTFSALVPNVKGLTRAQAAGLREAAIFISATETHSKKNINKTIAEAMKVAAEVASVATQNDMRVRGYLSCVWGCPYEGKVTLSRVVDLCRRLADDGIYQLSLGDTIGVGTPSQTETILEEVMKFIPPERLALHLHDTRGTALANALVGLSANITTFDSSIGGLGGCPYAPGAAGNLATEDLVFMLNGMGIRTGVDLDKLVEVGASAQKMIGRKLPGKYLQAALGQRTKKVSQR